MNVPTCCARHGGRATGTAPAAFWRRGLRSLRWLAPGAMLALLPKCPVCFAAWFALATGIGISTTTASHLRTGVAVLCAIALAALAAGIVFSDRAPRWRRRRA